MDKLLLKENSNTFREHAAYFLLLFKKQIVSYYMTTPSLRL